MTSHLRIFIPWGIISPAQLQKLVEVAHSLQLEAIGLGSRQEMYLPTHTVQLPEALSLLSQSGFQAEAFAQNRHQNLVSSYTALDIEPATSWLSTDTYLEALEKFDYQPRLKVNITDPQQNLVPCFTGELNYLASSYPRYWHLFLQLPRYASPQAYRLVWPGLVDSDDLSSLTQCIEQVYLEEYPATLTDLYDRVLSRFKGKFRPVTQEMHAPSQGLPHYEGLYPQGNRYWLGLYRRNHQFSVGLLEALYEQCLQTKVGKIGLTPWKSMLLKDIAPQFRPNWESFLGKQRVLLRHSATELPWQLPDLDNQALTLRNELTKVFEEKEWYTQGLSFAIGLSAVETATSVRIEQDTPTKDGKRVYQIWHTNDFTTNNAHWEVFGKQLSPETLPDQLGLLMQRFYAQADQGTAADPEEHLIPVPQHPIYQCQHCLTAYDPQFGQPSASIAPGTPFNQLPDHYTCSLCEASKTEFALVDGVLH